MAKEICQQEAVMKESNRFKRGRLRLAAFITLPVFRLPEIRPPISL
jgi:hypothetical protein